MGYIYALVSLGRGKAAIQPKNKNKQKKKSEGIRTPGLSRDARTPDPSRGAPTSHGVYIRTGVIRVPEELLSSPVDSGRMVGVRRTGPSQAAVGTLRAHAVSLSPTKTTEPLGAAVRKGRAGFEPWPQARGDVVQTPGLDFSEHLHGQARPCIYIPVKLATLEHPRSGVRIPSEFSEILLFSPKRVFSQLTPC